MSGSEQKALSTDAFIDVGEVTQLAGADTSIYNQQDMRRESQQYLFGIFQNVEEEKIEEDNSSTDGASDSTVDNTYSGDSVYDSSGTSATYGTGTGGTQVATVGVSIPVYSDSTQIGGTFIDVKPAFESKGISNYNNWANYEYNSTSNSWARSSNIKAVSGVHQDESGNVVDGDGRLVVAVGPGVMNPSRNAADYATASEMRYGTKLDVVLESNGSYYYIRCTVGDCKAHTYPSGVIQTGYTVARDGRVGYVGPGKADSTWTECEYDNTKAQSYTSTALNK